MHVCRIFQAQQYVRSFAPNWMPTFGATTIFALLPPQKQAGEAPRGVHVEYQKLEKKKRCENSEATLYKIVLKRILYREFESLAEKR